MKLIHLKEIAMTHKEYDSITGHVMSVLRSLFDVDKLVSLAKDSPYVQDKAKLDNAIHASIGKLDSQLDDHFKKEVTRRVKKSLGV